MEKFKKYALVTLAVFIFISFSPNMVLASDADTKDMGSRIVTDTNKVWNITFVSEVDMSSLSNNIEIKDITSGDTFLPTVVAGDDTYSAKVSAPSSGYIVGHKYQIMLKNNIKSKKGKDLPKTTMLTFSVLSKNSSDYNMSSGILVSPVWSGFKQITLNSTNLPGAQKYKIEGNNNLFDIGKQVTSIIPGDTVKVSVCDSLGNVLGTADMDVSTTKSSMSLNLNF